MRVYLDTAPVIYVVEQVRDLVAVVEDRLNKPDAVLVASDLTRMECRVKPLKDGDTELLADYDGFFEGAVTEIVTLSRSVMNRATEIRARYGYKTPDAIHLAAALEAGCDVFLTNDHALDRFKGIAVEVV